MPPSPRRLALATLTAAALLAGAPAAQAACPKDTTCEDVWLASGDGTRLHADVIRPVGTEGRRLPVILSIGPYFAHGGQQGLLDYDPLRQGPSERFKDLWEDGRIFERGYAMVLVDSRGFGGSEGCNDFGGRGEQADAKAAVEWAASQPWSNGRVGMWGKSYDGWTQVMALDERPKGLAATVIQSPIIDGYRTLYQDGVHYDQGWYGTPALYQQIDATPPTLNDSAEYWLSTVKGTNPFCYVVNVALQTLNMDADVDFWRERDLPGARGSDVPVLWSHGFLDANTKPDNFLPVWETLKGPRRAWFGQFAHVRPQDREKGGKGPGASIGREGFIDEAMRWLDRYVAGLPARVEDDPAVEVEDGATMKYRAEAAWPPADASRFTLPVRDATTFNVLGNSGETGSTGAGTWSVSQPLPHAAHLAGTPRLTVTAGAPAGLAANLHALLYDLDERGRARLVTRGAYAVRRAGRVSFDLYPQDWTFAAGHRVALLLAPSDDEWYLSLRQFGRVRTTDGALTLPFLRYRRDAFLDSRPSEDELARPEPFMAAQHIPGAEVRLEVPPELTVPAAAPSVAAGSKRRLAVRLTRRRGRFVAQGTGTPGVRVTVRLLRAGRAVQTRRITVRPSGRFTARLRRATRGSYRAQVTMREAGTTTRVRSGLVRVRARAR